MKVDLGIVLLLLAGLLVVISLVQPLATRLRLSSAVLLAIVGVAIGVTSTVLVHASTANQFDAFARVIVELPIHSDAFIYIFLPLLLFQTALTIEVQRIVEDAAPILLLAVVAVLVATIVIGAALAPIAGVSLTACLMLGSIVATTDPVAVIGIFRDVGAPARLSRLVEGESLLNDAAAITLFVLLLEMMVAGHPIHVGAASLSFVRNFLGGIAAGYVGGRLIVGVLPLLRDMRLAQVTLTLALPYLVFIVGERVFAVSGVVAAVTAGLVMTAIGQPRFAPDDWRFLQEMWEQLAFWASSLIFILASLFVPRMLQNVGWHDLILLGVLIAAALAARAVVLFGLLPVLSGLHLSQQVNNRFKTVIVWGGLRGAVTLALALAVTENPAIGAPVQRFIAVLATGFVLFTLLVNGTTLGLLIRLLGLDRLSPLDQALRDQVLTLSRDRVADAVGTIGARYHFDQKLVGEVSKSYAETASGADTNPNPAHTNELRSDLYPMLLGLAALANHERDLVRYQFAERTISGRIVEQLLANVGRLVDRTRAEGRSGYLRSAQRMVEFSRRFRVAHFLHRRLRIDGPLVDSLADRFELLLVNGIVLTELAPYVDEKLTPLLGESVTPQLHEILHQRQDMTGAALEALRQQYPAYADLLERRFLNRFALRREDNEYRTLFEEGVIGPELHSSLRREIKNARSQVELRPRLDLGLETRELIAKVPIFANLSEQQLDAVAHLLRPRFALPDEQLIQEGDRADAMYFISSGKVEVFAAGKKYKLGRGDFTGEMALVSGMRRQADVFARSYCQLLVLKEDDFQRLFKGNPEIKAQIDKESDARFEINRRARDAATD